MAIGIIPHFLCWNLMLGMQIMGIISISSRCWVQKKRNHPLISILEGSIHGELRGIVALSIVSILECLEVLVSCLRTMHLMYFVIFAPKSMASRIRVIWNLY